MAQLFAAFGKFGENNKGSIQNFGIVGITVGTEELTKFIFFYCPCNYPMNKIYGSTFIWGPAAILLVIGYVINRRTWRLTTGMCNRTQGVGKGCKRVVHFCFIFANISMKAVLAPATWIVISFLKGDYYACAAWPHKDDPGVYAKFRLPSNTTIPPPCSYLDKPPLKFDYSSIPESIARDLRAYSHIIGWWFLTWALMIGVFVMFIFRCLSKYSYEQSKYIDKYRSQELKLFEDGLDAKANAQAKIVVDQFFSKPRTKLEWDQIASINDKVMRSKRGRPIYSPMHKFVNKELIALELAQDDIVTDVAKKKHHLSSLVKKKKGPNTTSVKADEKKAIAGSKPPPSYVASPTAGIPMVAMAPSARTVVMQPAARPVVTREGTHTGTVNQQAGNVQGTTQTQAQVEPTLPSQNIPATPRLEDDPIEEANVVNRTSLVIPEVDDAEDPIKEANIGEQAEEIRQSLLDLVDGDAHESTNNGMDQSGYQVHAEEDDDSQPLI